MVRIDDSGGHTKCWLSFPDEKDELISTARSRDWERAIAMRFMVEVGCRASGVLSATPPASSTILTAGIGRLKSKARTRREGRRRRETPTSPIQ
ncbi:hypothetical protein ACFQMM_19320 [Saliphagus sp. GCM10025308]